jgi:ferritin-like metal-binding protein YciE
MDAGIIATAQRVEHYEMAGYGTVQTFAKLLGEKEAAELFTLTLNENGETFLNLNVHPRRTALGRYTI